MERRSRFVFGADEFTTSISVRAWTPVDNTVGGSRISAAGIPAGYVVRRDAILELTLRFRETEWLQLVNLIVFGQTKQALTWYPEADDDTVSWDVYLDSPDAGERFAPTRDAAYPRVLELTLTLRGVGTAVPWARYFVAG